MLVPKVDHMIEPILEFQRDKSRTALPAPQVEVVLDTSKAKDRGPDRVELRKVFFDGINLKLSVGKTKETDFFRGSEDFLGGSSWSWAIRLSSSS